MKRIKMKMMVVVVVMLMLMVGEGNPNSIYTNSRSAATGNNSLAKFLRSTVSFESNSVGGESTFIFPEKRVSD